MEVLLLPGRLNERVDWIRGVVGGNRWAFGFFEGPKVRLAFEFAICDLGGIRAQ